MATTATPDTKVEDIHPQSSSNLSPTVSDKERAEPPSTSPEGVEEEHSYRWLQLLAGMLLQFNTWSLIAAYGVFQAYYTTILLPEESESKIAWIGSIYFFLMLSVGFLTGPLYELGYLPVMLVAGVILITFGLMMTSLCHQYWQLMLSQGIVTGIGAGFFVVPSLAIPSEWYPSPKGRALALGAVASSSGLASIVYPVMFHYVQRDAGWRWAVRSIAFVVLGTSSVAATIARYKVRAKERRNLLDASLLQEKPYIALVFGGWFSFGSLYIPVNWLQKYYMAERQDFTSSLIFWLIPIAMAGSMPGRLIPSAIAVKYGALNVMTICTAIPGVLSFCWIAVHSRAAIIVFALVYGFFLGSCFSLAPAGLLSAAPHQRNIGMRIGGALAFMSLGSLAGLPLAGQILDSTDSYTGLQVFTGCLLLISSALFFAGRTMILGFTFSGPEASWKI